MKTVLRSRFFWKLYAGYSAVILISGVVIGIFTSQKIEGDTLAEITRSLQVRATMLKRPAVEYFQRPETPSLQREICRLGAEIETRVTVIRADGVVVADSAENPATMDNHANRPEVVAAHSQGIGIATRFSRTLKMNMRYVALPLRTDGRLVGFIRTSLPLSAIDKRLHLIRMAVVAGAGLSAIGALLFGFLLTQHVVRPIASMTAVAESMCRGNYEQRIPASRNDEVGELANAFNRMAESCRERTETINTDRNTLSAILLGMNEGVVAVDRGQRVMHLNEAAGKLLGASPKKSLGRRIWEVGRGRKLSAILESALQAEPDAHRTLHMANQPRSQFIEVHASPLYAGQGDLVGAVAVLHDVSEIHRLETVRQEFVANASHELKTPITAIRGLVETLIEDPKLDPATHDRFLAKIKNQSMRLSSLVSDLLTLSRLESDGREPQRVPFDLRDVVLASVNTFLPAAEERGIVLEAQVPEAPVHFVGDKETLGQMVNNLLDNAIKYTPERGNVWARLQLQADEAVIQVRDTGIGIQVEDQNRIFERFYRVDKARSTELGGTGLGLSIVKHAAARHGGRVTVQSAPQQGSTFRVFLPLEARAE